MIPTLLRPTGIPVDESVGPIPSNICPKVSSMEASDWSPACLAFAWFNSIDLMLLMLQTFDWLLGLVSMVGLFNIDFLTLGICFSVNHEI